MKILMLVNWKVSNVSKAPPDQQPPDYNVNGEAYWFFRYFHSQMTVDVVDISSFSWLEKLEKQKLRFYIFQTLKVLPRLSCYDLIISHGMQSGIVLSMFRRIFKTKAKHIVFDIGAFNSAATEGKALKLMQFVSRSIDGVIYHTSMQRDYYREYFPWIMEKSKFIKFGTDSIFFGQSPETSQANSDEEPYILCVGAIKRDWDTLYQAFLRMHKSIHKKEPECKISLKLIGKTDFHGENPSVKCIYWLPVNELIEEIRGAAFCVLPLESYLYSFGQMTLLQQMALGKAVITAAVPSMLDYVRDGVDALLYKSKDQRDLAAKMEQLFWDKNFCEGIGKNAACSVRDLWNEKHMAEEIEEYIQKICERKKS